ncbi:MAG: glycosyltransferase family 9 protein [Nitrospirota bacterium]
MPHEPSAARRDLLIQLARLGDLVQTLPAVEALQEVYPDRTLDVLCAAPLTAVLAGARHIGRVIPWDGAQWRAWADRWQDNPTHTLQAMQAYVAALAEMAYDRVYPLNQHVRSHLLTRLFSGRSLREDEQDHVEARIRPWAEYLRHIAPHRGNNRVHLADAWCGMSGVRPRGRAPLFQPPAVEFPDDLAPIGERKGLWVALVTGAGEADRCVPPATWSRWTKEFLSQADEGQVVLIGSGQERETGQAILESIPTLLQGRVWDATGRTTIPQLMKLLHKCRWVIGADTGPLHLGTLMGSRAIGFYFSHARVHETGPYGEGHWVYQYATQTRPDSWPIMESIALICGDQRQAAADWTLWRNRMDHWGTNFDDGSGQESVQCVRATVWRNLSPTLCESVAA